MSGRTLKALSGRNKEELRKIHETSKKIFDTAMADKNPPIVAVAAIAVSLGAMLTSLRSKFGEEVAGHPAKLNAAAKELNQKLEQKEQGGADAPPWKL